MHHSQSLRDLHSSIIHPPSDTQTTRHPMQNEISTRSPDDGLDSVILISVALFVMATFIGWCLYMCYCRPAPSVCEGPSQEDQSIPLQPMNPGNAGSGARLNPPLRTGPRLEGDDDENENPRGQAAVRMRGARTAAGVQRGRVPVRMHGGGTRMHGAA